MCFRLLAGFGGQLAGAIAEIARELSACTKRYLTFLLTFVCLTMLAMPVVAQSFFTSLVVDPAVGVDRGSTSRIQSVKKNTGFLTFSNNGAEEIGPYVLGVGAALPSLLSTNDQLDLVAVLAGPADDESRELLGGGIGYRIKSPETGFTLSLNGNVSDIRLGAAKSFALGIVGQLSNIALGLRREWETNNFDRVVGGVELIARDVHWVALGATRRDESLRMMRASLMFEQGQPFGFRKRFAISAIKGFDDFGASPVNNKLGSAAGVTTNFFRVAAGAEMSLPLSRRFYINAGVIAQWTNDSLPLSQRCGYQSNEYARGFDLAYVNGDRCIGSRVELAYNIVLPQPGAKRLSYSQAYFGLDGGRIMDNSNAILPAKKDAWSSISLGVRALHGNFISEVSVTRVLDQPKGAFEQDETRFWFRSALKF